MTLLQWATFAIIPCEMTYERFCSSTVANVRLNVVTVWTFRFFLLGLERREESFKLISGGVIFKLWLCFSEKKLLGDILNPPASKI